MFKNIPILNYIFKTKATEAVPNEFDVFRTKTERELNLVTILLNDILKEETDNKLYTNTKIGFKK